MGMNAVSGFDPAAHTGVAFFSKTGSSSPFCSEYIYV
jgi:hypothetical protein